VTVRLLHAALLAMLAAIPGLNTYDGEVPATPPRDPDGRVHPYAVLYLSAGDRDESSLAGVQSLAQWSFQVTCVGGDPQRAAWAVDKVIAALLDQRPVMAGISAGRIRLDGDAGPLRRDDDVHPPRHWTPLLFAVTAVPA
jgi:hypothetical protein